MKKFLVAACVFSGSIGSTMRAQITYPVDFRVTATTASTKRNVSLDNAVTDRLNATVKGFEVFLGPRAGGGGIGGRILSGSFADKDFTLKEGQLFIGESWFRVEGAYGQRSMFGTDSTVLFSRVGARSIIQIGGTGVSISLAGSKYLVGDFSHSRTGTTPKPDGWEGETGLFYTAPTIPLFAQLGYRADYFKFHGRAEHMTGVVIGAGIWLSGR
jgi:hypothetical protein